jgi:hypothetical protein
MGSPLLRKSYLREAVVALAGSSILLAASVPVKIACGQHTTLYLLPTRSAEVKSPAGAAELSILLPLASVELAPRSGSAEASGKGYMPLPANFPRRLNR